MKFNYDSVADAIYFRVNKGKVKKTVEMGKSVVVDLGAKDKIIGIEILNFSRQQNKIQLKKLASHGIPVQITEATPTIA